MFSIGAAKAATVGDCTFYAGAQTPTNNVYVESYASWDMKEFDPTVPDGTVLSRAVAVIVSQNDVYNVKCGSPIGWTTYAGMGQRGPYDTYASNVSGVGLRLTSNDGTKIYPARAYDMSTSQSLMGLRNTAIELVKTGPITAQGAVSGEIARYTFDDKNLIAARLYIAGNIQIKPLVPTCSVRTKSIDVSMDGANVQSFTGVGSTSGSKPFDITLNCGGGTRGAMTRMFMTMTDAANTGNRSTTLSLSPGSTARGVGYQVVNQNTGDLVSYGPDSSAISNPGQWFVGQYGNQDVTIPLVARYVQTEAGITAGIANAVATFTMSYQ